MRGVQRAVGLGRVADAGAEKGFAPAPATAADEARVVRGDEVRTVVDELRVDRENRSDRGVDLLR